MYGLTGCVAATWRLHDRHYAAERSGQTDRLASMINTDELLTNVSAETAIDKNEFDEQNGRRGQVFIVRPGHDCRGLVTADARSRKAMPGNKNNRDLLADDCVARLISLRHILCVVHRSLNGHRH